MLQHRIMCERLYAEISASSARIASDGARTAPAPDGTSEDATSDNTKDQPNNALLAAKGRSADKVLADLRRIVQDEKYLPKSGPEICSKLFWTCYMGSEYSGDETRRRASELSKLIGANFSYLKIDKITDAIKQTWGELAIEESGFVETVTNGIAQKKMPSMGGSVPENLALQNIQARSRMVGAGIVRGFFDYLPTFFEYRFHLEGLGLCSCRGLVMRREFECTCQSCSMMKNGRRPPT